jgi:hypothetical protein
MNNDYELSKYNISSFTSYISNSTTNTNADRTVFREEEILLTDNTLIKNNDLRSQLF